MHLKHFSVFTFSMDARSQECISTETRQKVLEQTGPEQNIKI